MGALLHCLFLEEAVGALSHQFPVRHPTSTAGPCHHDGPLGFTRLSGACSQMFLKAGAANRDQSLVLRFYHTHEPCSPLPACGTG